jgi:hypothetical protein
MAHPQAWTPLGRLALKSESDAPLTVELNGQAADREFVSERLALLPRTRREAVTDFYALASLHVEKKPEGRVALHCPARREAYVIHPHEWGNIWVYGMDIFLTGWMSREEFRHKARFIPPETRVFQYERTRVKNLAVDVRALHPIGDLLERVKEWESKKPATGL